VETVALSDLAYRIPVRDRRAERLGQELEDVRYKEHRKLLRQMEKRARRERGAGYAVYWMYLLSPLTAGVTSLVGLMMAASHGREADPVHASHFRFQVWTFWTSFLSLATGGAWAVTGGVAAALGSGSGGELALAGGGLAALSGLGFFGASLLGLSRLASGGPIGRLEQP
jgi:uncharacterized membrane protein